MSGMTNNTTSDTTASGAGEAESLGARIRREGDLSSRSGQLARLYDLADEADTLRAQLEAAEAECARLRVDADAIEEVEEHIAALAQQPAAVDGTMVQAALDAYAEHAEREGFDRTTPEMEAYRRRWMAAALTAALSSTAAPAPVPTWKRHCQTGNADVCRASQRDGVICADDECDIDTGVREADAAPAPVAGWLQAVDTELVSAHLGVANAGDDFDTARRKLSELIQWHIDVSHDPRVNGAPVAGDAVREVLYRLAVHVRPTCGVLYDEAIAALAQDRASQAGAPVGVPDGWRLVPVTLTREMLDSCGTGAEGLKRKLWASMLAAAPSPDAAGEAS